MCMKRNLGLLLLVGTLSVACSQTGQDQPTMDMDGPKLSLIAGGLGRPGNVGLDLEGDLPAEASLDAELGLVELSLLAGHAQPRGDAADALRLVVHRRGNRQNRDSPSTATAPSGACKHRMGPADTAGSCKHRTGLAGTAGSCRHRVGPASTTR